MKHANNQGAGGQNKRVWRATLQLRHLKTKQWDRSGCRQYQRKSLAHSFKQVRAGKKHSI